jgi:hypothetical protein
MSFLLWLLIGPLAWSQIQWMEAPDNHLPIFAKPSSSSRVLYYTNEGEELGVRSKTGDFTKIQVKRSGKWRAGYIYTRDLLSQKPAATTSGLGVGGGVMYSYLQQGSKSFETEDQVQYQTSDFTSTALSFDFALQYGRRDFWRLIGAYRRTDYSTTARTNVSATSNDVRVQHSMVSVAGQKVWNFGKSDALYFGAGAEFARALSATVKVGNSNVPTSDEDLPTYMGVQGILGLQFKMGSSLSCFAEFRPLLYLNQSPMVMGAELVVNALYWP